MYKLNHLHPSNRPVQHLTKVKYLNESQKEFEYVVGIYIININGIKLVSFKNKEIVILDKS